jgi:plastocyanin
MKNNVMIAVVLVVLAALGIWFMTRSSAPATQSENTVLENMTADEQNPSESTNSGTDTMSLDSEAKEISMEGNEFSFVPATLTLKKGEKVRLVFKNTGKMTHDFVVDELNVRTKVINGGTEDIVEFTPTEAGTFEYYCSVGKHREMGMKGTLTVTE